MRTGADGLSESSFQGDPLAVSSVAEHELIFRKIVCQVALAKKHLREGTEIASCVPQFREMAALFREIDEGQFAVYCDSLLSLTSGDRSHVNRNWSMETRRLVSQSVQILYKALFAMLLDGNTSNSHSQLAEEQKKMDSYCSKNRMKAIPALWSKAGFAPSGISRPAATQTPASASPESAPEAVPKSVYETRTQDPAATLLPDERNSPSAAGSAAQAAQSKVPAQSSPFSTPATPVVDETGPLSPQRQEFLARLAKAADEMEQKKRSNSVEVAAISELSTLISGKYAITLKEALDSVPEVKGVRWTAVNPTLKIAGNLLLPIQKVLGDYAWSVACDKFEGKVEAKCVGAYFVLAFPMGLLKSIKEKDLLGHYDRSGEWGDVAYVEFLQRPQGEVAYAACIEASLPSFTAYEVAIAGKQILIPNVRSVRFEDSVDKKTVVIPSEKLFGIRMENRSSTYMIVALEKGSYAIPIESYRPVRQYTPASRDLSRFRKFGYAGTAEIDGGRKALVWDLSVAVDRWTEKFL